MQLLCSMLCEVYIIHINGIVIDIIETDRFIIAVAVSIVIVKVVSAFPLKVPFPFFRFHRSTLKFAQLKFWQYLFIALTQLLFL